MQFAEFKHCSEALRAHIQRHSVTLVTQRNGVPKDVASGTCIECNGIYGIATAAHVVKGLRREDVSISYKPSATKFNALIDQVLAEGGGEDDPLDVAFLTLTPEGLAELFNYKDFLPHSRLRSGVSVVLDDLLVVHGTPNDLIDAEAVKRKELRLQPMSYVTHSLDSLPSHFNSGIDIGLAYPSDGNIFTDDGGAALLPDAGGLSGGGIWLAAANKQGLWSPEDACLVGVEISWHPKDRWVRGNQIQHVIALEPRRADL